MVSCVVVRAAVELAGCSASVVRSSACALLMNLHSYLSSSRMSRIGAVSLFIH